MTRTVFIHCGLHKTGTTAIQTAFDEHRETLHSQGVLYPTTSDKYYGHHNLAWEMTGDHRFNANALTITKVVSQIAAFDGSIVLSSEDFESFLHQPAGLAPLVRPLQALDCQVCLVIYFRDRASYVDSLYVEMLKHGYPGTFDEFEKEVRLTNQFRFREWIFQFDYCKVRTALESEHGIRLKQGCYNNVIRSRSVVTDFLEMVGLPADLLGAAAHRRENVRASPIQAMSRLVTNRAGRPLSEPERETINRLFREMKTSISLHLDRMCSAQSIATIEALASSFDLEAESALVEWWQDLGPRLKDCHGRRDGLTEV